MWSGVTRRLVPKAMKQEYESFMRITPCPACKGQRLKKESLAVTVAGKNIYEVTNLSIDKLKDISWTRWS